jgi:uncharacterized membrane protein
MNKRNKIIYWIATIWLASGMLAGGIQQVYHSKGYSDILIHVGYPLYFMTIIGVWKILGVVAILIPGFRLLKEWAYAGFFFVLSGAVISHLSVGDGIGGTYPAATLLLLTVISWYFRPVERKIIFAHQ